MRTSRLPSLIADHVEKYIIRKTETSKTVQTDGKTDSIREILTFPL